MTTRASKAWWFIAAALIGVAAAAIFGASIGYEFVWDDRALLQEDVRIRSLAGVLEAFASDFFRSSDHTMRYGYYRPIVTVSYAFDFYVWRDWPGGYHLTNIVLHILCSLGVFWLARHMRLGLGVATGVALLFAAHPLHTESVTWISGRTDVIATLFAIGYLAGFDHPRLRWRALAYLSFALAALSKEVALATPAVAFFMSAIRNDTTFKERVRVVFPAVPILMVYIVIRLMVVPVKPSVGPPNGWQEHLFGSLGGLSRYLRMLVWPVDQCAYLQTPVSSSLADPWAAMGLAIILGAVYLWLVHKPVGQMAFAALLSFVPMANIVRIAAPRNMGFPMSERFLYLPSLVVLLAMGFTWVYVRDRLARNTVKRGSWLVAILVIVVFGFLTARTLERNKVWKDELTMFTDAKSKVENAPLIDWQLASVYRRKGFLNKAQALVMEAVQRSRERRMPIPAPMIVTLATTTAQNGDVRGAIRVLERYQRETGATHAMISYNLGVLKEDLGQNKEALIHYRQAYTLRPKYVPAYMSAGVSLLRMGQAQRTIDLMDQVHALDPRNASAWHAKGIAQRQLGDMGQALASFSKTIEYKPSVVAPRIDAAAILLDSDPSRALELLIAVQGEHPNHKKLEAAIGIVRERIGQ